MTYETQTHALIVKPTGEPIYSAHATIITLNDEGAGPFIVVKQQDDAKIAIDPHEWPALRDAIEQLMQLCQPPRLMYMQPGYSERQWDGKGDKPEWMKAWIAAGNDPMDCLVS